MKKYVSNLFTLLFIASLTSCGNDVEEIKNPSTGKLMKRYEYYTDDSGQKIKDGEYVEWDAEGNKVSELQYQDDSLNGSCTYYDQDGTIASYNYVKGKLDGLQSVKNGKGNWVYKENYNNGVLDGNQTYYHSNGKTLCLGHYTSGEQNGKWKYFDDEGKLEFHLTFKNGVPQELLGTWALEDDGITCFTFKKDGTFTFKAPYFRYSRQASLQGEGPFSMTSMLELTHKNGAVSWEYEVFDLKKDELTLFNPNAEIEEAILVLKRK